MAPLGFAPNAGRADSASVAPNPAPPESSAAVQEPAIPSNSDQAPDVPFGQFFTDHISFYEPIYFILGTYPAAAFQFSLKYKVLNVENGWDPLAHFYFGYTQTSYWDLLSSDPSFYDTSYKPSGFFRYYKVFDDKTLGISQSYLQFGVEHESNGRGGTGERSLNTVYVQPCVTFGQPGHLRFTLEPRAWYYLSVGGNNPDLAAYRGYGDLLTALTWKTYQLAAKLRYGDRENHTGLWLDFRFQLPKWLKFNPAIQVEYFNGYGETLRQYNQISQSIRAGLCLWYPDYVEH